MLAICQALMIRNRLIETLRVNECLWLFLVSKKTITDLIVCDFPFLKQQQKRKAVYVHCRKFQSWFF
jgi:hypothetical protein